MIEEEEDEQEEEDQQEEKLLDKVLQRLFSPMLLSVFVNPLVSISFTTRSNRWL